MPFPMQHICIAKKIIELNPNIIKNFPQYYLGNLAPDAIHFRDNFKINDKFISHLCAGDEKWGEISNNEEWTDNVLKFLNGYNESENIDFIYGYCVHILADMRNNVEFWTPFKLKIYHSTKIPDSNKGYDAEAIKMFHADLLNADIRLYNTAEFKDEVWGILNRSNGVTLDSIIFILIE